VQTAASVEGEFYILRSVEKHEVSIALGIVVEKRKSSHPWADWTWMPVAVVPNAKPSADWEELVASENCIQYLAGTLFLTLHRKDCEALRANLMLPVPELYIVLQEGEDLSADFPYFPHSVTASAYDAQDAADAGDDIVEKVAMPEPVAAFVQAFVEEHYEEETFIKRKRDKLKIEEQKFGKDPIFSGPTRH